MFRNSGWLGATLPSGLDVEASPSTPRTWVTAHGSICGSATGARAGLCSIVLGLDRRRCRQRCELRGLASMPARHSCGDACGKNEDRTVNTDRLQLPKNCNDLALGDRLAARARRRSVHDRVALSRHEDRLLLERPFGVSRRFRVDPPSLRGSTLVRRLIALAERRRPE
jgi:hypothetical protein